LQNISTGFSVPFLDLISQTAAQEFNCDTTAIYLA
jgi:hypothetical protein